MYSGISLISTEYSILSSVRTSEKIEMFNISIIIRQNTQNKNVTATNIYEKENVNKNTHKQINVF